MWPPATCWTSSSSAMQIFFFSSGYHLLLVLHLYLYEHGSFRDIIERTGTPGNSLPFRTTTNPGKFVQECPTMTGFTNGPEQSQNTDHAKLSSTTGVP